MPRKLLDPNQIKPNYQRSDLQKRRAVLADTVEKFNQGSEFYHNTASENHQRWRQTANNVKTEKRVRVVEGDWGTVTQGLSQTNGNIYAVLNMANAFTPGGGYLEGMAAQEENMFRRTNCHFYINDHEMEQTKQRYTPEMTALINGEQGQVFLDTQNPRVCIKGQENPNVTGYEDLKEENYFLFYELRAAADDLRKGDSFNEDRTRKKIRAQLNTLKARGVRHVVLSAFGCGAFENPPEQIARIYREELEQRIDDFDDITFAIYNPGYGANNYPPFYKALDGLALTSELRDADRLKLDNFLDKLATQLNSTDWDQKGYRFPLLDFRKTPKGIDELRQVLNTGGDSFNRFNRLQEIAQERLDNPPVFTQRNKTVHDLYTKLIELKIYHVDDYDFGDLEVETLANP